MNSRIRESRVVETPSPSHQAGNESDEGTPIERVEPPLLQDVVEPEEADDSPTKVEASLQSIAVDPPQLIETPYIEDDSDHSIEDEVSLISHRSKACKTYRDRPSRPSITTRSGSHRSIKEQIMEVDADGEYQEEQVQQVQQQQQQTEQEEGVPEEQQDPQAELEQQRVKEQTEREAHEEQQAGLENEEIREAEEQQNDGSKGNGEDDEKMSPEATTAKPKAQGTGAVIQPRRSSRASRKSVDSQVAVVPSKATLPTKTVYNTRAKGPSKDQKLRADSKGEEDSRDAAEGKVVAAESDVAPEPSNATQDERIEPTHEEVLEPSAAEKSREEETAMTQQPPESPPTKRVLRSRVSNVEIAPSREEDDQKKRDAEDEDKGGDDGAQSAAIEEDVKDERSARARSSSLSELSELSDLSSPVPSHPVQEEEKAPKPIADSAKDEPMEDAKADEDTSMETAPSASPLVKTQEMARESEQVPEDPKKQGIKSKDAGTTVAQETSRKSCSQSKNAPREIVPQEKAEDQHAKAQGQPQSREPPASSAMQSNSPLKWPAFQTAVGTPSPSKKSPRKVRSSTPNIWETDVWVEEVDEEADKNRDVEIEDGITGETADKAWTAKGGRDSLKKAMWSEFMQREDLLAAFQERSEQIYRAHIEKLTPKERTNYLSGGKDYANRLIWNTPEMTSLVSDLWDEFTGKSKALTGPPSKPEAASDVPVTKESVAEAAPADKPDQESRENASATEQIAEGKVSSTSDVRLSRKRPAEGSNDALRRKRGRTSSPERIVTTYDKERRARASSMPPSGAVDSETASKIKSDLERTKPAPKSFFEPGGKYDVKLRKDIRRFVRKLRKERREAQEKEKEEMERGGASAEDKEKGRISPSPFERAPGPAAKPQASLLDTLQSSRAAPTPSRGPLRPGNLPKGPLARGKLPSGRAGSSSPNVNLLSTITRPQGTAAQRTMAKPSPASAVKQPKQDQASTSTAQAERSLPKREASRWIRNTYAPQDKGPT